VSALLVRRPEELTPAWLTAVLTASGALGRDEEVTSATAVPVGTGQMADTVRLAYTTSAGRAASVVVKLASDDDTSRSTGVLVRAYEVEVGFYAEVAGSLGVRTPACHLAAIDEGREWFTLVLEDVVDGVQGDQLAGCTPEVADAALVELAALHAPAWGRRDLAALPFLDRRSDDGDRMTVGLLTSVWPGFVERYRSLMADEHLEVAGRLVAGIDRWMASRPVGETVTHGDFRLDNLLLGAGRPVVVDWQTAVWGSAATDVAYFLGGSLTVEDRRRHGSELLAGYHRALVAGGVADRPLAQLEAEVAAAAPWGMVMCIVPAMIVQRTERGDRMFTTSLARYADQAIELGSLELLG
jgi:aminoglycoside/choline kinase family phosphotransferase